jgi:hypothetical protein
LAHRSYGNTTPAEQNEKSNKLVCEGAILGSFEHGKKSTGERTEMLDAVFYFFDTKGKVAYSQEKKAPA